MISHYKTFSAYGFSDETDGSGRFDRYSILLIGEIWQRLIETDMQVSAEDEALLKGWLRQSVDVIKLRLNPAGNGVDYGRSLSAYADTAFCEVLSAAEHMNVLTDEEKEVAYAFATRVAALGLGDRVIFAGLVPPPEIPRYVGIMDALVHLSYREGLPRALPQALAAGRPVVAYDTDGSREVCIDRKTGFLLPAGDAARLPEIVDTLATSPDLRERLGAAGRDLVRQQFTVERMVDDLYTLYRRLGAARGLCAAE